MVKLLSNASAAPWLLPAAGVAAVLAGGAIWATLSPSSPAWGPVHCRGPRSESPSVALTFDDGPTPAATDAILDILAATSTPAAFFVIGQNVHRAPDLLRRIDGEGHLIANHSYDHSHFGMLRGPTYWRDQLQLTDATIEAVIDRRPLFFRPPMGVKTPLITAAARSTGHVMITWSRRAIDGIPTTGDAIRRRIIPHASAGDIIVLHDGIEPNGRRDPAATIAALPDIIDGIRGRGMQIVRLDHLLHLPAYAQLEPAP